MKAFGISNRDPGQHERAMISKWADTYCFDTDIIIEACNRTIKAIHQPSFEYADTILSKWKSSNITTMADIKRMMQHMQQAATAKPDIRVLPKPVQQNSTISSSVIRNLMTGTTLYLAITINLSA